MDLDGSELSQKLGIIPPEHQTGRVPNLFKKGAEGQCLTPGCAPTGA